MRIKGIPLHTALLAVLPATYFAEARLAVGRSINTKQELYGRWKVQKLENFSTTVDGSAQPQALIGSTLTITPKGIRFSNQACENTTFEKSSETAEQMRYGKVDTKALRLPDPTTIFDADCTELMVRNANELVFTWNGYFFTAKRVNKK